MRACVSNTAPSFRPQRANWDVDLRLVASSFKDSSMTWPFQIPYDSSN